MSDILKVENLTKIFVKKGLFSSKSSIVKAADDVSFSLKEGEVFVLAGESGSGKSTIARLIMKARNMRYIICALKMVEKLILL